MTEEISPLDYKVTVVGAGISVDRPVDQVKALAIVQIILGGGPMPPPGAPAAPALPAAQSPRLSVREALEESGAATIPAKIVAIGCFLRDQEGQSSFTRDDSKARFKLAGEPIPANFPRDFHKALKAGWIAQDHESVNQFYVTRRGDEAATARFGAGGSKPARARKRPLVSRSGSIAHDKGNEQ